MFNRDIIYWMTAAVPLVHRRFTFGMLSNGEYEIGLFCRFSFLKEDKTINQGVGFRHWRSVDLNKLHVEITDWIKENNQFTEKLMCSYTLSVQEK